MSVIIVAGHDLVIRNCRQGETPMAYKTIQTQTLAVAKTDSIKRGFVKHFVDFIAKRGNATVAELQAELGHSTSPIGPLLPSRCSARQ
jgi:hypothetical protein